MHTFKRQQFIPASISEVWDFISSPANLKHITPDYMGFEVLTTDLPDKMYAGMIITYHVRPLLGLKMKWVTEISQVRDKEYFVDQQLSGPYSIWHHQHILKEGDGGVLMTDIINYKPPLGFLGRIANFLFIRNQIKGIFDYRTKKLNERFLKPEFKN